MVWVRFDDQFPIHRKVSRLVDGAFRMHVSAIFWCARALTDGVIPEEYLDEICPRMKKPERVVAELVRRGLWHEAGEECSSKYCPAPVSDGWAIHDYLEYQPTKEKVDRQREANAERQRRWREQQSDGSADGVSNGVRNALRNASRNGPVDASVTRPRPVPSRRDRDGTGSQSSSLRNAREDGPEDDDSIDLATVELLTELTGQPISILWAAKVRQRILHGRSVAPRARMAYVTKAIRDNPAKFAPTGESSAPPLRAVPDWCGTCDERTRLLDVEGAPVVRCPACHPLEHQEAS